MPASENSARLASDNIGEWVSIPRRGNGVLGIPWRKLHLLVVPSRANKGTPAIPKATVTLRESGQKRAVRLVHVPSILTFLREQAEAQAEAARKEFSDTQTNP